MQPEMKKGTQEGCQDGTASPHHLFSISQQVAAFVSSLAMRSQLLLSVDHLPTIRETSEEMLPARPGQEPPASPSLDDYVRSICQLAQPTSVLDKVTARGQPNRSPWIARASGKSHQASTLLDSSPCFSDQQPTLPSAGIADPLDWLFGESQEKQPNRRDLPRGTCTSPGHRNAYRQINSSKARGAPRERLCEARVPGRSLARPSQDGHQSSSVQSCTSGQPSRATIVPCHSRPSSILRSLYLHLPVIHEF